MYMEEKLGAEATTPTICVLRTGDEVERYRPSVLPCVIKPTNSCGRMVRARSEKEYIEALPQIMDWFHEDYFVCDLEKNYATLERKVIVEEYLDDSFSLEGRFTVWVGTQTHQPDRSVVLALHNAVYMAGHDSV